MLREDPAAWGVPEEWLKDSEWLAEAAVKSIRMMDEAGIPMGSGADLVGLDQVTRGWEISLKAAILGGSKAIQSATRVSADILGIGGTVGTLEPGKVADIVAFSGDPVAEPGRFRTDRPILVMKGGILVRQTQLPE
jgi:imidazolonepropionase-like amidohydrolase